jgi:hypothetical protein
MANFAIVEDGIVKNIIVAESLEVAQEVTGKLCIECSDSFPAQIGGTWDGQRFIPAKPYDSWVLNQEFQWEAPVPEPTDGKPYEWNESTKSWVEI